MGLLDYKVGLAPCELFSSQFIKLFYEGAEILFRVLRYSFVLVDNIFCQFGKLRCLDKQEFTFRGSVYYGDQKKTAYSTVVVLALAGSLDEPSVLLSEGDLEPLPPSPSDLWLYFCPDGERLSVA